MSTRTLITNQANGRPIENKSFGELLGQLATESSTLVRNEIILASKEAGEKATVAGKAVGIAMVAAFLGLASLIFLGVAGMEALTHVMPRWAAALIVAGALLVTTTAVAVSAMNRLKNLSFSPNQTIQTLKEDSEWLKKQV